MLKDGGGDEELELQATQGHHDRQVQQEEQTSSVDEQQEQGDRESDQPSQWALHAQPQRQRQPPRMLTYDSLGQPIYC